MSTGANFDRVHEVLPPDERGDGQGGAGPNGDASTNSVRNPAGPRTTQGPSRVLVAGPLYNAAAVGRMLDVAAAYHRALAAGNGAPDSAPFLSAVRDCFGAHHAGLCVIDRRRTAGVTVHQCTAGADLKGIAAAAGLAIRPPAACEAARATLTVTNARGSIALCLLRAGLGAHPFGPADAVSLRLICATCPPAALVRPRSGSRREQVLQLLLQGRTEQEVAAAIGASQHTVHAHVRAIYRSHHVNSRAELIHRLHGGPRLDTSRALPPSNSAGGTTH